MLSAKIPVSRENWVNFCCRTSLTSGVRPADNDQLSALFTNYFSKKHMYIILGTYCKACWESQMSPPSSWWCESQRSHHTQHPQNACRCHCSKLKKIKNKGANIHLISCFPFPACFCGSHSPWLWKVKRPGVSVFLARWVILQQVPSALSKHTKKGKKKCSDSSVTSL